MSEPIVYIAAPLSGADREANKARAARWVCWAAARGVSPVATWIVLSSIWTESPENRARGLAIDCRLVEVCDAVLWVGGRVSDGMRTEGEHARALGIPVIDLTGLGDEPPQFDYPLLERVRHALRKPVCPVCVGNPSAREIDGCSGCGLPFGGEQLSSPGVKSG